MLSITQKPLVGRGFCDSYVNAGEGPAQDSRLLNVEPNDHAQKPAGLESRLALRFTTLTMPGNSPIMPIQGRHFEPGYGPACLILPGLRSPSASLP
jgi:hypothetical protein